MTFEECIEKLKDAADRLRSGKLSLEESAELYLQATACYKEAEKILSEAKQKIEIYNPDNDTVEDFEN